MLLVWILRLIIEIECVIISGVSEEFCDVPTLVTFIDVWLIGSLDLKKNIQLLAKTCESLIHLTSIFLVLVYFRSVT